MSHKRFFAVLLIVALVLMFATAVEAGKYTKAKKAGIARSVEKAQAYGFADEMRGYGPADSRVPLVGATYNVGASPGNTVGNTYYDYQHNCSMGRMVECGPHTGVIGQTMVHFSWMYMPDSLFSSRSYAYNAYNSADHSYAGVAIIHDPDLEYSGYVNVDVTPDNRGIVGGHSDQKGPIAYMPQMHFDACSGCEDFTAFCRLPDSLGELVGDCDAEFTWPKFFLQFGSSGVDTVLHVAALSDCAQTGLLTLGYFRYLGYEGQGYWDPYPRSVDTVEVIAQDIIGERVGDQVCLSWFGNTAYGGCDTCSGPAPDAYAGTGLAQMDNDMYVQISRDQGATWDPRENVTQNVPGAAGWKAYCASSILFDQTGNLHVVWVAAYWDADPDLDATFGGGVGVYWYTRLLHWSEDVPHVRTIADHTYGWQNCTPPAWAMHLDKPALSECDGRIYCTYTQFNNIPQDTVDDCAAWYTAQPDGAANGDLFVSISEDGGMTWDLARNLTATYTPNCDPSHGGDDCSNDYYVTMSRWGRAVQTGEDWSGAVVVDPDPDGYPGGTGGDYYYLDVQYVQDLDAGGVVQPELGSFQFVPIKWFRMPCVEAIANPNPMYTPGLIDDPAWAKPGIQVDTPFTIENAGNTVFEYTVYVEEDNGTSGWLNVTGLSGSVPSGLSNTETGTIHLNDGGVQTDYIELMGRIIFDLPGNSPTFPDTIPINFFVVDTMVNAVWDTIHTSCLSLTVSNNGNMGHDGRGRVNMDYYDAGDCDTFAVLYMYDGSAIVGYIDVDDTIFNYSFWGSSWLDDNGLRPQGNQVPAKTCGALDDASFYQSGTFTTPDSSIGITKAYLGASD
ncbi:MAG: exo-alpha-sialidase, partial [Candidatus Zixiibacteriota bacterium]